MHHLACHLGRHTWTLKGMRSAVIVGGGMHVTVEYRCDICGKARSESVDSVLMDISIPPHPLNPPGMSKEK